jgi:SAM-dependent methyltransferase
MDAEQRAMHEANRLSWNEATKAHNSHKGDQAAFFRAGKSKLYPEERELLGDLHGKRVVHLQCNSGQDTLGLVQLGGDVTGVDISDEAVDFARRLSADSGVPARFVRSDVYDWLEQAAAAGERFDVVFSSYGALCWLSDIKAWARGVAGVLAPGGRYVTVEFHPVLGMLEEGWKLTYDYFCDGKPLKWDDGVGDYVAQSGEGLTLMTYEEGVTGFKNPNPSYDFSWPVSEVITALVDAGLVLETFREYPFSNGFRPFPDARDLPGRRTAPPESMPTMPLMYAVCARKP